MNNLDSNREPKDVARHLRDAVIVLENYSLRLVSHSQWIDDPGHDAVLDKFKIKLAAVEALLIGYRRTVARTRRRQMKFDKSRKGK